MLPEQINQAMLARQQGEIEHLVSLMEIHTRNFRSAEQQYAKWGDALVPPIVLNNLDTEGAAVELTMRRLQTLVSEVYGADIAIPELDNRTLAS